MKNQEITLIELLNFSKGAFKYLSSKWFIFIITGFIGVVVGVTYSSIKKTNYSATLTFALEEKNSNSGISSIASSFGLTLGEGEGGAFSGDNILELLKSKYLVEKTLLSKINLYNKEQTLIDLYIESNDLRKSLSNNMNSSSYSFESSIRDSYDRKHDSIIQLISNDIIKNNISVYKIEKKSNITSVSVTSLDEVFSKLFCEKLVENAANFYVETKVGKSKKNLMLLQNRVDSVKMELDQAIYGRANFTDKNTGLIRQSATVPKQKQEIRVQMLSTMYGELIKNLEFSKLTLLREEPLFQIIDYPRYPLSKDKIGKMKASLICLCLAVMCTTLIYLTSYIYKLFKIKHNI